MDEITLLGLEAFGHHGVLAHERENGQKFVIDVRLSLDLSAAAASDDVADTVHYGVLADRIVSAVERDPVNLIEKLADRILDLIWEDGRVATAAVTVHKPQAPIEHTFGDVSVTRRRSR